VDLRRALLLFAIVLGVAAIASSIARPPERDGGSAGDRGAGRHVEQSAGADASRPAARTVAVRADRPLRKVELASGRPVTLLVAVTAPGQIEIPRLGLVEDAERLTPARFDLLVSSPGRYPVSLRQASAPKRHQEIAVLAVK